MLLVDSVVQGAPITVMRNKEGRDYEVPGPGTFAEALGRCSLRYVLDRAASRQCSSLFRTDGDIPGPSDVLTRFPGQTFWLETFRDGEEDGEAAWHSGSRIGFLVEVDHDGRAGHITCFSERSDGRAEYLGCVIAFGFDGALPPPRGPRFRINPIGLPAVADLLDCARLEIAGTHRDVYTSSTRSVEAMVTLMASSAWVALPMLLSFSALLNTKSILAERRSDLVRLNAIRRKQARPELLEHINVRLDLTRRSGFAGDTLAGLGARRIPRLHFVRGHTVRRGGKSFWRNSHLRGEGDEVPTRTVNVTATTSRRVARLEAAH